MNHFEDILSGRVSNLNFVKTKKDKNPYKEPIKKKRKPDWTDARARKRGEV